MDRLTKYIDGTSIAIFRIGFGLIMLWELIYFVRIDFVKIFLTQPKVQFPYEFASFLKPLPEPVLNLLVMVLMLCCVFIIIGRFYKKAMIVFFLGFTYLFLLDKAYYNNHLYLLCLLSFLLIFIPADHRLSFAKKKDKNKPTLYWHLLILKLQLAIVYFYGGIAKLNQDWLFSSEPMATILNQKAQNGFLGDLLVSDGALYFFTYGGVLFDLLIPFLLFIPKTRVFAVICALFFNIMNAWIFSDINIFPYFMMLSLVLFLDVDMIGKYVHNKMFGKQKPSDAPKEVGKLKKPVLIVMAVYFVIQGLLPFRHFLYEGNVDWTGLGQRFAWRMKIQHRTVQNLEFKVLDMQNKVVIPVDLNSYRLNQDQITQLYQDPRASIQLANYLKNRSIRIKGLKDVEVRSDIVVKFNGRQPQSIFDKSVDLSNLDISPFKLNKSINPINKN